MRSPQQRCHQAGSQKLAHCNPTLRVSRCGRARLCDQLARQRPFCDPLLSFRHGEGSPAPCSPPIRRPPQRPAVRWTILSWSMPCCSSRGRLCRRGDLVVAAFAPNASPRARAREDGRVTGSIYPHTPCRRLSGGAALPSPRACAASLRASSATVRGRRGGARRSDIAHSSSSRCPRR